MSDVRVHYNSSKPIELGALAYTQGTNIHVAPGMERYLPHEAWHVVQQAQGRVQPTVQMKEGIQINDDTKLENEADVMGTKSYQLKSNGVIQMGITSSKLKRKDDHPVTTPEENATTPEENATTPEENATTPEENATTPEENTTTPVPVTTQMPPISSKIYQVINQAVNDLIEEAEKIEDPRLRNDRKEFMRGWRSHVTTINDVIGRSKRILEGLGYNMEGGSDNDKKLLGVVEDPTVIDDTP